METKFRSRIFCLKVPERATRFQARLLLSLLNSFSQFPRSLWFDQGSSFSYLDRFACVFAFLFMCSPSRERFEVGLLPDGALTADVLEAPASITPLNWLALGYFSAVKNSISSG